ncbi:MAG TPA: hypothetical protein VGQ73_01215 [Gemmatimonadales bacterium]|jgi:hypothetical protein|nr:hypothetical protein [Gemmatimonadales bacterium]
MNKARASDSSRALLRHLVATLAYRAAKVLRDPPPEFGSFSLTTGRRTPVQIVAHLGDLMTWAWYLANGEFRWAAEGSREWDTEVQRFFARLAVLDERLAADAALGYPAEVLIQGPLADALTHVGQLALLRGAAGAPVRPESYARAEIVTGRVGMQQATPGREFEGDASTRQTEAGPSR